MAAIRTQRHREPAHWGAAAEVGETWAEANQRHLAAELARIRTVLEAAARREAGGPAAEALVERRTGRAAARGAAGPPVRGAPGKVVPPASAVAPHGGAPPSLEALTAAFGLSPFERDVLLLAAAMELEGDVGDLCAAADAAGRPYPTFALALAVLPGAHWSALSPVRPLRRRRLLVLAGDGVAGAALRIDERVLHHLAGVDADDPLWRGVVRLLEPEAPRAPDTLAERLAAALAAPRGRLPALCGGDDTARRALFAAACSRLGLRAAAIALADVPAPADRREELARRWEREALLTGTALLVDGDAPPEHRRAALAFAADLETPCAVGADDPIPAAGHPLLRLDLPRPTRAETLAGWRRALGPRAGDVAIEAVAAEFALGPADVRAAAAAASAVPPAGAHEALWDACRAASRDGLAGLAQRIEPAAGWEDLVLPAGARTTLRRIAAQVRHRATVDSAWGFGARGGRGEGIGVLFAGPSGTGKTMAAEVLAADLRLDIHRIDLSAVVSKYIGETEKHLRRVFDGAGRGGAILLFDEADALFGRRSEVRDSHDRFANVEVSYLLQRMEDHRGLAVLTTNAPHLLDPAFLRRLRFVVSFPWPEPAERAELWARSFPPGAPIRALDPRRLAQLNVAGGQIRTIAHNAAFLAADAGEPIGMTHILEAARDEYGKLGRPLTDAEVAGWT